MTRPALLAAPLATGLILVGAALHPGCKNTDGVAPLVLTPCPNVYAVAGGACLEAGMVCSYVDLSGCQAYYQATCGSDLRWTVELPSCGGAGHGGGGGTGAAASGGGGAGGTDTGGGGTGTGGAGTGGGAGGAGLVCDDAGDPNCSDPLPCLCEGCVDDGNCGANEDCICADCSGICGCLDDGVCSPFYESCGCVDCALHPLCP
ncbi:MAG: hypothetical protein IT373_03975 [Polyangiaceae bacterium]|nr:hypothetical protein [Polyangiaceae bacterium]